MPITKLDKYYEDYLPNITTHGTPSLNIYITTLCKYSFLPKKIIIKFKILIFAEKNNKI